MRTHSSITPTVTMEPKQDPMLTNNLCSLSLEESEATSQRGHEHLKLEHRLNRYEIENAFLKEQNNQLMKELSFARYTIQALKSITTQKESALQATRQELDRAYFRVKMLGMTLMRQEQLQQDWILRQHLAEQSGVGKPDLAGLTRTGNHETHFHRRSSTESQQLTPPESPRKSEVEDCGFSPATSMLNCSELEG